jgi:DNA-binding NarL/FixJ family response regulator
MHELQTVANDSNKMPVNLTPTIRVVLAGGYNLVREALRSLLQSMGGFLVVGETSSAPAVLDLIETHRPDVVLLMMEGASQRQIMLLDLLPDITERALVLIVTGNPDARLQAQAIEQGAAGVVMGDQSGQVLVKALRKVCAGEIWLDRASTAAVVNQLAKRRADDDPETAKVKSLTPRERQIVALITEGLTNREIAGRLRISEATARNHVTSILAKLEMGDRFHLTVYAFRNGLVLCPTTPAMLRIADTMIASSSLHRRDPMAGQPSARRRI